MSTSNKSTGFGLSEVDNDTSQFEPNSDFISEMNHEGNNENRRTDDNEVNENDDTFEDPEPRVIRNEYKRKSSNISMLFSSFQRPHSQSFMSDSVSVDHSVASRRSFRNKVLETITLESSTILSRFSNWTREQLIELLIKDNIELRQEHILPTSSIRELADELYSGRDMPKKPRGLTFDELVRVVKCVKIIQNKWIMRMEKRRRMLENIIEFEFGGEGDEETLLSRSEDEDHFDYSTNIEVDSPLEDSVEVDLDDLDDLDFDADGTRRGAVGLDDVDGDIELGLNTSRLYNEVSQNDSNMSIDPVSPQVESRVSISPKSAVKKVTRHVSVRFQDTDDNLQSPSKPTAEERRIKHGSFRIAKKVLSMFDIPWKPPSHQKAMKYSNYLHPRRGGRGSSTFFDFETTTTGRHCCVGFLGEQCDIWDEAQMSEFAIYGPAVTNYFKFLKWCFWLFFILSILTLPILLINFYGPNQGNSGLSELTQTTLGNLASTNSENGLVIPICQNYGGFTVDCRMSRQTVALIYSWTDILCCIVVLIAFIWLREFEMFEEKQLNRNTLFASMYTIMVTNLPPDTKEEDIRKLFQSIVTNKLPIAQVEMGFDNEYEIEQLTKRGDLIRLKKFKIHEHRYDNTMIRQKYKDKDPEYAEKRVKKARIKLLTEMRDIDGKIKIQDKLLKYINQQKRRPVAAFITFNDNVSTHMILNQFSHMTFFTYYFSNHKYRMFDEATQKYNLLGVTLAPEPSTVIWEHLGYTFSDRFFRRALTTLLALGLIFISITLTLGSKYFLITFSNNSGTSIQPCDSAYTSLQTVAEEQAFITENPQYVHCYCSSLSNTQQSSSSFCKAYYENKLKAQFFQFFSSVAVLLVNTLIEYYIRIFAKFEKHHSLDMLGKNIFIRLFFLKYINTGVVYLINNNQTVLHDLLGAMVSYSINSQVSNEFSPIWYQTVGVSILLVQIGNIFTSHIPRLYYYYSHHHRLANAKKDPSKALTQEALNKLHIGPDFEIYYSYAEIMSTLFVCFTFSAGMPILYDIITVNIFVFYFIEKYLFVNFYRSPPHLTNAISKNVLELIPIAVVCHLCMSIWILSDPTIFPTSTSSDSVSSNNGYSSIVSNLSIAKKYDLPQTLNLFVMLIAIIGYWIIYKTVKFFTQGLDRILRSFNVFICSCFDNFDPESLNKGDITVVTYARAVQRNLIKGLNNYNILQNPVYKEAFAITWKFAVEHRHFSSIRLHQVLNQNNADEVDDVDEAEKLDRARLKNLPNVSVLPSKPTETTKRNSLGNSAVRGNVKQAINRPSRATAPIGNQIVDKRSKGPEKHPTALTSGQSIDRRPRVGIDTGSQDSERRPAATTGSDRPSVITNATRSQDRRPSVGTAAVGSQSSDRRPSVGTAAVGNQGSDRRPSVGTAAASSQSSDRRPSVGTAAVGNQGSDRRPSVGTAAVGSQSSDRRPSVGTAAVGSQSSDRRPSVGTAAASSQSSDRRPSVGNAALGNQGSDRRPSVGTAAVDSGKVKKVPKRQSAASVFPYINDQSSGSRPSQNPDQSSVVTSNGPSQDSSSKSDRDRRPSPRRPSEGNESSSSPKHRK